MNADFAMDLASRLQSHQTFWDDFQALRRSGVRRCIGGADDVSSSEADVGDSTIGRLLYCASIFAQTESESNRALAQAISLSAVLSTTTKGVSERSADLLSAIGNFPGAKFVSEMTESMQPTLLSYLNHRLLSAFNSVDIGGKDVPLTDFQADVWKSLGGPDPMSISAPTSAGKSFLVIEYICKQAILSHSYTAIYVAPTRALLAEVGRKIMSRLGEAADTRVSTVPGFDPERRSKQIFVLTQERLHVLLAIANVSADVVVVDEAQNLADGARGMILQDCLERLKQLNPKAKVILLSPGAVGFGDVARLLDLGSIDVRSTGLSPVLQNRIRVKAVNGNPKALDLSLIGEDSTTDLGILTTKRGVGDARTRLAAAALELGSNGGSLVYATGQVEAEKTAKQLSADLPRSLSEKRGDLSAFIREHIHPSYGLADMVLHGVAFHYGRMPTLLREALEKAFSGGDLSYLVCTTTLFQGVNLPARSVFINTPTRGRGTPLEPAHLWNFAGRAGRLGKDLVGNVFLVDYEKWAEQSLDQPSSYRIAPALAVTVEKNFDSVVKAMNGELTATNRQSPEERDVGAAAGLLIARASANRSALFLDRLVSLSAEQRSSLESGAARAAEMLELPAQVIENNWTVNLHGLKRLATRMREKIEASELEDLVPVHPSEPDAFGRYSRIFGRIAREILGMKGQSIAKYGAFVATYAIPWMNGAPYPVLLKKWIDFRVRKKDRGVDEAIRSGFDFFEEVLRFQMVQIGKAYVDVLNHVLAVTGHEAQRVNVFDYALALELGVSTTTGRAFVELGMSRIAAVALESLFPDSELTPTLARHVLASLDLEAVALSPVITAELRELRLIST